MIMLAPWKYYSNKVTEVIEIHITPEAFEDLFTESRFPIQCMQGLKKSDGAILVDIKYFNGMYALLFEDGRADIEVRPIVFNSVPAQFTSTTGNAPKSNPQSDYDRAMSIL